MDSKKKRTENLLLLVGVILIIVAGVVVIQPKPAVVKEASGSYQLTSDINLLDQLRNNSLYGNNRTLENPGVIYNNITKNLSALFVISYSNSNAEKASVQYEYTVFIQSSDPSWQYRSFSRIGALNVTSGSQNDLESHINVSSNLSIARGINSQLGVSSAGTYSIYFVLSVSSSIGTSSSNMTLTIGNPTDNLNGPLNSPVSGSYFTNVVDPGKIIIPLGLEYAYLILSAGLLLAAVSLYMIISSLPRKSYVEKFKEENKGNIIMLNSGPPEGSIEVKSTEDLMRMAAFIERPVFVNENRIFVEMDGKTYFAEIRK